MFHWTFVHGSDTHDGASMVNYTIGHCSDTHGGAYLPILDVPKILHIANPVEPHRRVALSHRKPPCGAPTFIKRCLQLQTPTEVRKCFTEHLSMVQIRTAVHQWFTTQLAIVQIRTAVRIYRYWMSQKSYTLLTQ